MKYKSYAIGIDPGVNTGLCVWSKEEKKIISLESVAIHEALNKVLIMTQHGELFVRLEDARLRSWIPRQKTEKAEFGKREGAGSVKRDCKIWEDFLTDHGIPFELVPPKNNRTKITSDYFKKLTKWTGRTNSHMRDAAMLVVRM